MTIIRTPRKWPGFRTHRRHKYAGKGRDIVRLDGAQDRDLSTHVLVAHLAVNARNTASYREEAAAHQRVLLGRDRVDVESVHPESGTAVVNGSLGYATVPMADLVVRRG